MRRWIAYALTVVAAGWLHEFAVLALPAHGLTLYLSRLPRALMRSWAIAAGLSVIAVVPLALRSAGQSGQVSWIGWPHPGEWLVVAAVTLVGLLCAGYATKSAEPATGTRARVGVLRLARLALPLLIAPTAMLLLASLHDPVYLDRYVLYSQLALALLIGVAVDRLWDAAGRITR